MSDGASADPRELLDEAAMSRAQKLAIGVTCALSALDGYDTLAISFAAPALSTAWHVGRGELGLVLSSGLIGMAAGSLLLAPLADRFGRRAMVLCNLLIMALGMAASSLSASLGQLAMWRFVTGMGIGSMVPIVVPFAAELSNRRYRSLCIAVMTIGYPLGGMIGGLAASLLLRQFAWQSVFVFGVAVALLLLPVSYVFLPESLAFLLERRDGRSLRRVNGLLARFGHSPVEALPPATFRPVATPYREIFVGTQRLATFQLVVINLLFLVTVSFFLNWLPQLIADAGHTASQATFVSAMMNFAGIVGCVLIGYLTAGRPIRVPVASLMIATGISIALFGFSPSALVMLAAAAMLTGFLINSGVALLYQFIANGFEARFRTTGVGFVMGIGRLASALGPALGGGLLSIGLDRSGASVVMGSFALAGGIILLAGRAVLHPGAAALQGGAPAN